MASPLLKFSNKELREQIVVVHIFNISTVAVNGRNIKFLPDLSIFLLYFLGQGDLRNHYIGSF